MKLNRMSSLALLVFFFFATSLYSQEAAINDIANDLAKSLSAQGPPLRVAVVDFTDLDSNVTNLGRYLAQEIETSLATSPHARITLVNRTRLKELLQEYKLGATGIIDQETAEKLGKIAGVQALITGTVTPLDQIVRVDVEVIDTEDARVLAATSKTILKTREIAILLGQTPPEPAACPTAPTGGPAMLPASSPSPQAAQVFESHDIRFALNSCARSSTSIICRLTITNMSDDRDFWIHNGRCDNHSRIIDNTGREFRSSEVILGSGRANTGDCQVQATLVNQVPTRTEIRFDNIPSDVSKISLLEISTWLVNNQPIDVSYHKVPLTQQRY